MANRGSGDSRRGGFGSQGRENTSGRAGNSEGRGQGPNENSDRPEDLGRQGLTGQGSGKEEAWRPGQSRDNSEVRSQGYGAQDGKSTGGYNREVSSSSSEGSPSSRGTRAGLDSSVSEREKRGASGKSSNTS